MVSRNPGKRKTDWKSQIVAMEKSKPTAKNNRRNQEALISVSPLMLSSSICPVMILCQHAVPLLYTVGHGWLIATVSLELNTDSAIIQQRGNFMATIS